MKIKITIGLELDSGIAMPHQSVLGELVCGPNGLLNWLESQLGLELPPVSFTVRTMQYLACLKSLDAETRFYHRSLAIDELGVAKRLLAWRDVWYEAGWQGHTVDSDSQRLTDIAAVEAQAKPSVSLGTGQRIQRVLAQLALTPVSLELVSLDSPQSYPSVWQSLLMQLNCIVEEPCNIVRGEKDSDLATLQALILGNTIPKEPRQLSGDGSVILLTAPSHGISAPWTARYLKNLLIGAEDYEVGLLCGGSPEALDLAMEQAGVASPAISNRSPWRPIFQVLPLAIDLLWAPLNPIRLLEYLSHPIAPIPRRVRQKLAEVVSSNPGIGGKYWQEAVREACEEERESHDDSTLGKRKAAKLESAIDFWLNCERYDEYPGAPASVVLKRADAISNWMAGLIVNAEEHAEQATLLSLYHTAQNQVRDFHTSVVLLQQQGAETINADTLRRLINSVRGSGASRPDRVAEQVAGQSKLCVADSSAAFVQPLQTIVWWGCDTGDLSSRHFWSLEEQADLEASGVHLPNDESTALWQSKSWERPILSASKRIALVVHASASGHHPLFDLLHTLVKGIPESDLLTATQHGERTNAAHEPSYTAVSPIALPKKQRVWRLPPGTDLPRREEESFSSLDSFLFGPYLWVLRYQAKLKQGPLLTIADDNLLKGTLAHELFEAFFTAHTDIAAINLSTIEKWALPALNQLVAQQGAVLLAPGRSGEREHFVQVVLRALSAFAKHLQQAKVVAVVMESEASGTFVGGAISGFLDVLVTKADGTEAVVDVKWGGAKYRRSSLQDSKYLQLAIYSELRRQLTGTRPSIGYYIIDSQDLLMLSSDYFPSAESVDPTNEEGIAEFWLRFTKSWQQRREQLDGGMIEVNVSGTELDESMVWDDHCLEHEAAYEKFSEFGALVGWELSA